MCRTVNDGHSRFLHWSLVTSLCFCFPCFQWWQSMTTCKTKKMNCLSKRGPSSMSLKRMMMAGMKVWWVALQDSSLETTSSPSCTTLSERVLSLLHPPTPTSTNLTLQKSAWVHTNHANNRPCSETSGATGEGEAEHSDVTDQIFAPRTEKTVREIKLY